MKAPTPYAMDASHIVVKNPKILSARPLPAERIPIGNYYKPSLARLPNDELRLVAEATKPDQDLHGKNDHPILASRDGG